MEQLLNNTNRIAYIVSSGSSFRKLYKGGECYRLHTHTHYATDTHQSSSTEYRMSMTGRRKTNTVAYTYNESLDYKYTTGTSSYNTDTVYGTKSIYYMSRNTTSSQYSGGVTEYGTYYYLDSSYTKSWSATYAQATSWTMSTEEEGITSSRLFLVL